METATAPRSLAGARVTIQRPMGMPAASSGSPAPSAQGSDRPRMMKATQKARWPARKVRMPTLKTRCDFGMSRTSPAKDSSRATRMAVP